MLGRQLANYRVFDEVGSGAMGVVYAAEDLRLRRQVALKLLPPALASDEKRLQRLRREAYLLAKLDHPGIVTIHSIEESEGTVFLTMQLVRGKSLDACIPEGGMPAERTVEIALRVSGALAAAHRAGIVHRDIKPSNIMVADDGRVKILDFGLAKAVSSDFEPAATNAETEILSADTLTQEGAICGTPAYMAPEQISGLPSDSRCDIFSLGAVIFEMATGQRPFRGAERSDPPSASSFRPGLPRVLDDIIVRCLQLDPAKRWVSAEALQQELGRLGAGRRSQDPRGEHVASLAIMPLLDRSSEQLFDSGVDPNWFADGLTEALVTGLARLESLRVTASTSMMRYRDQEAPASEVGRELGVDYILNGSVLRVGNRIRVSVHLVDTSTESVVWADEYTKELEDVLSVQGEVAQAVADEIRLQLSPEDRRRVGGKVRVSKEALKAYLYGRHFWSQRFQGGLLKAIDCFKQALELAPGYAPAYSGLADCHIVLGWYAFLPPQRAFEAAREAASKALEIDPLSPEALTSMASVNHLYDWDWAEAERLFKRAIELNPSYAHCRWWYAFLLMTHGRPDESREQTRAALALDPLSLHIKATAGWMRFLDERYEQARALLLEAREIDDGFALTNIFLGWLYERLELYDEASRSWQRALEKLTMLSLKLQASHTLAVWGKTEEARQELGSVEAVLSENWVSPCQLAVVHLALGERHEALELVKNGIEVRDPWALTLALDYRFDGLRDDELFAENVQRIRSGAAALERS